MMVIYDVQREHILPVFSQESSTPSNYDSEYKVVLA